MSRYLAIEWNGNEARLAVAASRGDRFVLEHAFTLEFPTADDETADKAQVGQQIAAALHERAITRVETLVAIGRTNIELRQLALPPAPDEELPDMVRIQAMRDFNALEDDWPLDFIPMDDQPEQPRNVLAAAIDPELVAQIVQTCEAAGLKPQRLVLRPCAAASLLNRMQSDRAAQLRLLVDLVGDEADLTVVVDQKVIFLRTARLPGDPLVDPDAPLVLLGEIRRTMAAVQNRLGGRTFDAIILCGMGPAQDALCHAIHESLPPPVETFDPFAGLELGRAVRDALPEHPARFAPLLGLLADEFAGVPHAIDFLHPRHRPEPPDRRRQYALAGLAAGLLVAAWFIWSWWQRTSLESEILSLNQQDKALDARLGPAEHTEQLAAEIGKWTAADVTWLDELYELCQELPPAQDVMLTNLAAESSPSRSSRIELQGLVRSAKTIDELEQHLRDPRHKVEGLGRNDSNTHKGYTYHFKSSLLIEQEADKRPPDKGGDKRSDRRGERR